MVQLRLWKVPFRPWVLFLLFAFFISQFSIEVFAAGRRSPIPKKGILVFVPGSLNWMVPGSCGGEDGRAWSPYFSSTILKVARDKGYDVTVIRNLKALGDFEENGKSMLSELEAWYSENYAGKKVPITLLGHSAGGFYSLHAATLGSSLPIKKIITVATPLNGTEVANALFDEFLHKKGDFWINALGHLIDVRGLLQLTTRHVEDFLSRSQISARIKVYAVGGAQPRPGGVADWTDFNFLCPLCDLFAKYLPEEESDGLVTVSSALGTNALLRNRSGSPLPIHRLWDLRPNLDHVEQLLDYRLYLATGILNPGEVDKEQKRFYSELLNAVEEE